MRKTELDSLRGIAAFAVLLYHATAASLQAFFHGAQLNPVDGVWLNALMFSPLRIFTAGPEAVWLFFMLSGFVLVRSASRPGYRWDAYYPSRIIRLYIPVVGAVILTALIFVAIPHQPNDSNAVFVAGLPSSYSVSSMIMDATLLTGTTAANVPLWSLQWEVLFSLLLPVAVLLARRYPRVTIGTALLAELASAWTGSLFLLYMPMFVIGSVLGYHWEAIAARLRFFGASGLRGAVTGALALLVAIFLITATYTFNFAVDRDSLWSVQVTTMLFTVAKITGNGLLLAVSMLWRPLRRLLQQRPLVALGSISFSLYLTHGPIVIGLLFLLGPGVKTTIVQIVTSMVVAVLFYFLVEKHAHRLARAVARRIQQEDSREAVAAERP